MEFSMDQPSILATLRADYLLFLSQRNRCGTAEIERPERSER
jgi:hypothetical protein